VPNIRKFLLICAAILNKYHLSLEMLGATVKLARQMLEKFREPNVVQALVEQEGLRGECNTRGE